MAYLGISLADMSRLAPVVMTVQLNGGFPRAQPRAERRVMGILLPNQRFNNELRRIADLCDFFFFVL